MEEIFKKFKETSVSKASNVAASVKDELDESLLQEDIVALKEATTMLRCQLECTTKHVDNSSAKMITEKLSSLMGQLETIGERYKKCWSLLKGSDDKEEDAVIPEVTEDGTSQTLEEDLYLSTSDSCDEDAIERDQNTGKDQVDGRPPPSLIPIENVGAAYSSDSDDSFASKTTVVVSGDNTPTGRPKRNCIRKSYAGMDSGNETEDLESDSMFVPEVVYETESESEPYNAESMSLGASQSHSASQDIKRVAQTKSKKSRKGTKQCPQCPKKFLTVWHVRQHIKCVHSTARPFKCDLCPVTFKLEWNLLDHKRRHQGDQAKTNQCLKCPKKFFSNFELKLHQKSHSTQKQFKCNVCGEEFKWRGGLRMHHKRKHQNLEKSFQCSTCPMKFLTRYEISRHARSHSDQRPFKCTLCDKTFKTGEHRAHHVSRDHKNRAKNIPCTFQGCSRKFYLASEAKYHLKKDHLAEKKSESDPCDEKFKTARKVKSHSVVHSDTKTFTCQICDKKFKCKKGMIGHVEKHLNYVKSHSCELCKRSFWKRSSLINHMKFHSEDFPFHCSFCKLGYLKESSVKRHEYLHHDKKWGDDHPFKCPDCGKGYRTQAYMERHHHLMHVRKLRMGKQAKKENDEKAEREPVKTRSRSQNAHGMISRGKAK